MSEMLEGNTKRIKVAAYCRVSTLLGQSIENQLTPIQAFCDARGFDLVEAYTDSGISGAKERRPALDRMVGDARKGKFKIIIVSGIDRLARNTRHLLNLVWELHSSYGVGIVSLRENLDFSTPLGQAALTILGAIAELERELCRERIRTALAAKKLAAEKTGNGWRCGRPRVVSHKLEDEVKALRGNGVSIRNTAKRLGVSKSTVQRILSCAQKRSRKPAS